MISLALAWVLVTFLKQKNGVKDQDKFLSAFFITGFLDAIMIVVSLAIIRTTGS